MGKPQVLVRFKQGDHAYFGIEGREAFEEIKDKLNDTYYDWICVGDFALLKRDELVGFFYFPEGYAKGETNSMPQG